MASQSFNLGANPFTLTSRWTGALAVDPALIDGGGTAFLREFGLGSFQNTVVLRLASTADGEAAAGGPEFKPSVEFYASAITLSEAGGSSVTLPGPAVPSNVFADASEPYEWNPGSLIDPVNTWIQNLGSGDVTLTIHEDPLALSDFDSSDLDMEALALIEAGAAPNIFSRSPREAVGELIEGDLEIGASGEPITRLRVLDGGSRFAINDSGLLDLSSFFGVDGPGNDLTVYIQTSSGLASWTVADDTQRLTSGAASFMVPSGQQAVLSAIVEGTKFIFALGRSIVNRDAAVSVRAGSPTVSVAAQAQAVANRDAQLTVRAGAPVVSVAAHVVKNRDAQLAVRAGSPAVSVAAQAEPIANRDAQVAVRAGSPTVSVGAQAEPIANRDAQIAVRAGAPVVSVAALAEPIYRDAQIAVRAGSPTVSVAAQAEPIANRDAQIAVRAGSPAVSVAAHAHTIRDRDVSVSVRAGSPSAAVSALAEQPPLEPSDLSGETPGGVRYRTREGDTVDAICWSHYGRQAGAVEVVLEANPGLSEFGPVLPAGMILGLPDVPEGAPEIATVSLWD